MTDDVANALGILETESSTDVAYADAGQSLET